MNKQLVIIKLCLVISFMLMSCQSDNRKIPDLEMVLQPAMNPAAQVSLAELIPENGAVINFWASWCIPCRAEMPSLAELNDALSRTSIGVILISIDDDPYLYDEYLREWKTTNLMTSGTMASRLLPLTYLSLDKIDRLAIPTTYLVDGDGQVIKMVQGEQDWSKPYWLNLVRSQLYTTPQ